MCISLSNTPKFAVDSMLGTISKKLRILGYDSTFSSDTEDEKLLNNAKDENRVIITKDTELSKKAKKSLVDFILLTKNDEAEQFNEIKSFLNIDSFLILPEKSRCTACNGMLKIIQKESVTGRVEPNVMKFTNRFWECILCKKIFWEGSHIKNLQIFFQEVNLLT